MCLEGGIGQEFLMFAALVEGAHFTMAQGNQLVSCLKRFHLLQTALLAAAEREFPTEWVLVREKVKKFRLEMRKDCANCNEENPNCTPEQRAEWCLREGRHWVR